ncbi:orotidine-5'-phosphate decarboxylase [Aeromicrobium sp.]|uniref:orotidine-5'-phosphate decarboxylase n=1 Tax=Aeromicrobium sp. TaxID=1871063 RepID=UPI0019A87B32|nr:orotidine-5'-phosphate decarboxylase [Aeromicrobium sp.]MBC7631473.1 orotidine-5'-phosphate decarboxylase [Aeromicrobium sp.]
MSFGSRAHVAMAAYGPACVGIDPHASLLADWGLPDNVEGLDRFASLCVEAFAGHAAFVKPQSAFFERFGARGVVVLERTIQDLRHTGSLVILDVKRGDIGSTAAAYADAYLDEDAPMAADAITVSPYLGFGSLQSFFDVVDKNDAGVFVLALTSNKGGPEVQQALLRRGPAAGDGGADQTVAGGILTQLATLNAGSSPMGSFGAVVGATLGDVAEDLDINGPLLVPGFGAQGGTADDIRRLFGAVMDTVIPSTSRAVLSTGPDVQALRDSVARVNAELVGS